MKLERFMYLNVAGAASLYSQLRGEDVVETLYSMEHSKAGRLAGSENGLIDRGEKKSLDKGARKWCSRVDENRSSRTERE